MGAMKKNALRLLLWLWFYTSRAEHSDDYIPMSKVKPPASHGRHHRNIPPADVIAPSQGAINEGPSSARGPIRPGDRKKHRGKNKPHASMDSDGTSSSSSSKSNKRGVVAPVMPHDMEATMNRYWERAKQVLGVNVPSSPQPEAAASITDRISSSTAPTEVSSSSPSLVAVEAKNGMSLPSISLFAGFTPPDDIATWNIAAQKAQSGEQVLLNKLLEVIKTPLDLFHADAPEFKWASNAADIHIGKDNPVEKTRDFSVPLKEWANPTRDPVVIFGTRVHQRMKYRKIEGAMTKWSPFGAMEMLRYMNKLGKNEGVLNRRIVGIGAMDENWGWLSSHFVNRTVTWYSYFYIQPGFRFGGGDPFTSPYNEDEIRRFIEDPNLTMFMTNQHHNITNPKVISVPLGIMDVYETWYFMHDTIKKGLTKKHLLFSAGSDFGARPYIRECVKKNVGEPAFFSFKRKEPKQVFNEALRASKTVLAMPGLGYDTYRLWEALAFGSVPVMERGFGLDRTVYKLPVLLVDDFYDLTKELLEQAYIEAIYRGLRNEWEFQRMKPSWWLEILFNASVSGTSDLLMERHPVKGVVDTDFTRPLVPFDCKAMGGCGNGTKKMPNSARSCSIYPRKSLDEWRMYKWNWFYD